MTALSTLSRGRVAVIETRPETVLADVRRAMELAGYREALPRGNGTLLEIGTSYPTWYPGAGTTPWQLEGTIRELQGAGYEGLVALPKTTSGADPRVAAVNHKHRHAIEKFGLPSIYLDEPEVERVRYQPTRPFLVLDRLFPEGVTVPKVFVGRNAVVLPTIKPHDLAAVAGAMMDARGGVLGDRRQRTLAAVDESLVDLLQIRLDIHAGLFAVMDGTSIADDTGTFERNLLLASTDLVAIDAVSASLQGFDPMGLPFVRIAHEKGLGIGEPREIEIVGHDRSLAEWQPITWDKISEQLVRFSGGGLLAAARKRLVASPATALTVSASDLYRNAYWYPLVGRKRVIQALDTDWGRTFVGYGDGNVALPNPAPAVGVLAIAGTAAVVGGISAGRHALRKR